jgi:hypothetical protein
MRESVNGSLQELLKDIVKQARKLKDKHTEEGTARVNYACVFAQNRKEYDAFVSSADRMGKVVKNTPTGPLFNIAPLDTEAGELRLIKIRLPDKTRPERGDADFTVQDYFTFKKACLAKPGFKLILRESFEMIELMDPDFDVRAYFSNLPLDKQLGLSF